MEVTRDMMEPELDPTEGDPLLPGSRRASKEPAIYDTTTGVALFLNYIVGTGCFALPFAFAKSGYALRTR